MASLNVNGRSVTVDVDPSTPLVYVLRNDLGLNGPKLGCGAGLCGACTVHVDGRAVRSCQAPLSALAPNARIVTLEGLGTPERPHPLQAAFIAEQAVQCGYCTSGMIMEGAALLARTPSPSEAQIREHLGSNLCRCGCQQRVVRAMQRAARGGV
jgi:nicotinate dehydrogenase subunit A